MLILCPCGLSSYGTSLLTQILIFSILAMSLNLLIGYTGLVSFNHASFMGIGAYAAGLLAAHGWPQAWLALSAGVLVPVLLAMLLGLVIFRSNGAYFLLLTLAFGQMILALVWKWRNVTGGDDGLSGISRPEIGFPVSMWDNQYFYYLILLFFIASYFLLRRLLESPYGKSLVGIRESESRMQALGYNTWAIKFSVYIIAAAFSGLAGVLYAWYSGFICPQDLSWKMSGLLILMVIIGGAGSPNGPILGTALILLLQNLLSSYTEHWLLLVGLIFIFCVIYARSGITGYWQKIWNKGGDRYEGPGAKEP